MQLHEQYQDKIACISVSLDYIGEDGKVPDSVVAEVKETLVAEKIAVENVISSDSDLAVMERLDIAIPAVFVYDTEGKLFQKFSANQDAFNYKDNVNPAVAKLLQ